MKWDEMTPRERDALVAEKVMGWVKVRDLTEGGKRADKYGFPPGEYGVKRVPKYTTDISAAWGVAKHLRAQGCSVFLQTYGSEWVCHMTPTGTGIAPTETEAICLAALKAVGVEIE